MINFSGLYNLLDDGLQIYTFLYVLVNLVINFILSNVNVSYNLHIILLFDFIHLIIFHIFLETYPFLKYFY